MYIYIYMYVYVMHYIIACVVLYLTTNSFESLFAQILATLAKHAPRCYHLEYRVRGGNAAFAVHPNEAHRFARNIL